MQVGEPEWLALVGENVGVERHDRQHGHIVQHGVHLGINVRLATVVLATARVGNWATCAVADRHEKEIGLGFVQAAIGVVVFVVFVSGSRVMPGLLRTAHLVPFDPGVLPCVAGSVTGTRVVAERLLRQSEGVLGVALVALRVAIGHVEQANRYLDEAGKLISLEACEYHPAEDSAHLDGSSLDVLPPPGKSRGWLKAQLKRYQRDVRLLDEGDHVHATFPDWFGAPVLGGAKGAGLVNPMAGQ